MQQLLCSVIKFHVVKEAKEAVLFFEQDFRWTLIADDNGRMYRSNLQFIES